jgi:hypothetical protein
MMPDRAESTFFDHANPRHPRVAVSIRVIHLTAEEDRFVIPSECAKRQQKHDGKTDTLLKKEA